jgi:uncharacterized protein YhaN
MSRLKIEALANVNFGLHQDKSLAGLGHDFVVVYGKNETGKSTISEFICWTVAGPWRSAADGSARFETKSGNKLSGRMIAELNSETLDIESSFTLLKSGKPNDARTATLGKRTIASGQISTILNQLTPDDYRWIYVVNGVDLSRSKTADDFSDLFSSFTTGLSTGGANLREILKELDVQLKSSDKAVKALNKQKKEIRELIADASGAPSRLNGLIQEKNKDEQSKQLIDEEIAAISAERGQVKFALRAIDAKGNLSNARFALQGLETVPAEWNSVLPLFGEICRLQNEIERVSTLAANASSRLQVAKSKRGFADSEIQGRTFSVDDRLKLRALFTEVSESANLLNVSEREIDGINTELAKIANAINGLLGVAGVDASRIPSFKNQSSVLDNLRPAASLWESAAADVDRQRAAVAGLKAPQIPIPSMSDPHTSEQTRSGFGVQLVAAVAAVCGAAFVRPEAGVLVSLVVVAAYFLFGRRSKNVNPLANPVAINVVSDISTLNQAEHNLASYMSKEEDLKARILEALQVFGVAGVTSSNARPKIEKLIELSKLVDQTFDLEFKLSNEIGNLDNLKSREIKAKNALSSALRALGVLSVPETAMADDWLADYEEVINASSAFTELRDQLSALVDECKEHLGPISGLVDGLPWSVVKTQFEHFVSLSESVSTAQSKLREAEIEFSAAGGGSAEVQVLLDEYPSEIQLKTFDAGLQEKLSELSTARDDAIKFRTEKLQEIRKIESEEILPSLNLEVSEIEENLIEAQNQLQIDKIAFEIYEKVIERFERDNQDPLIKEAQKYISEIVDQWGDLLFSRDEKGKVQIERDGQGGKLPQNSLSEGARALLFLGIRLAFVNKDAEKRGIRLPILCDDPFIHFDDSRRDTAMKLFGDIARNNQVIMFTCEESTRDLALLNGAHLVNL